MEYYEDDRHSAVADDFLMCQEEEDYHTGSDHDASFSRDDVDEPVFSMEMDICVACGGDHMGMLCSVVAAASAELERDRDLEYFNSPSSFWATRRAVDLLNYQYREYVDSIPPLSLPLPAVVRSSSSSSSSACCSEEFVFVIHERQIKCC